MKKTLLAIFIFSISLSASAWQNVKPPKPTAETDVVVLGDINSDTVIDTAYMTHPKWISEDEYYGDCTNHSCSITVAFSFKAPSIQHSDAVDAWVKSIGDIDEDGIDEIVVAPGWFIGCRGKRYFYTMKNGKWQLIGETYYFNCIGEDEEFDPEVKKTARARFETPTLEFLEDEGEEITVTKTFTIKSKK